MSVQQPVFDSDKTNIDIRLLFTHHYPARCLGMSIPKSRDIQTKIPVPQAIWNFGYVTVNGVNSNDIRIGSSRIILISSQYINKITIRFQRKCFKGKIVRVDGFRSESKSIYKNFQHRIDSVRDEYISFPLSYNNFTNKNFW